MHVLFKHLKIFLLCWLDAFASLLFWKLLQHKSNSSTCLRVILFSSHLFTLFDIFDQVDGLLHTSILQALTIHNFRLVKAIDLKCGLQEAPTYSSLKVLSFICLLIMKLWSSKFIMCGRPFFTNSVTYHISVKFTKL